MGGIAAVVASGWTQVKNIFGYLSSFIIVSAEYDRTSSRSMTNYLRTHWKLLPSGKLIYRTRQLWLFKQSRSKYVPFRLPAKTAIYRKGKQILFVTGTSNRLTVSFLRGTVNTDELLSLALDDSDNRTEVYRDECNNRNRYCLRMLVGREKGAGAMGESLARVSSKRTGNDVAPSDGDGAEDDIMLTDTLDKSFKYDSTEWMQSSQHDPFESLYYPKSVEKYINQAIRWRDMKDWYAERDIPWRRGWTLYGGPGTGKTSLSNATAKRLGIPLYIFNLNTMSDQELIEYWDEMETPCMALFEDFDNVFHGRVAQTEHKLLSFDCVLNVIGGAKAADGVFLMVTTNDLSKIDPAMGVVWGTEGSKKGISSRPGRIDTVIYLGPMEEDGRLKLAKRILVDWPEAIETLVKEGDGCSAVQFQEMCLQYATERIENDVFNAPSMIIQKEVPSPSAMMI